MLRLCIPFAPRVNRAAARPPSCRRPFDRARGLGARTFEAAAPSTGSRRPHIPTPEDPRRCRRRGSHLRLRPGKGYRCDGGGSFSHDTCSVIVGPGPVGLNAVRSSTSSPGLIGCEQCQHTGRYSPLTAVLPTARLAASPRGPDAWGRPSSCTHSAGTSPRDRAESGTPNPSLCPTVPLPMPPWPPPLRDPEATVRAGHGGQGHSLCPLGQAARRPSFTASSDARRRRAGTLDSTSSRTMRLA